MSKAILVMNMPKYCSLCMFCKREKGFYGFDEERCLFTNYYIHYDTKPNNRECPLKEAPEKYTDLVPTRDLHSGEYEYGWNACVDEILGEK